MSEYVTPEYYYNDNPYWDIDELVNHLLDIGVSPPDVTPLEIYSCRSLTLKPNTLMAYFYDDLDALCEIEVDSVLPSQSLSKELVEELLSVYTKVCVEVSQKFWEPDVELTDEQYEEVKIALKLTLRQAGGRG